nr:glycine--tRNA ligase subunit beta [uncultured Albidiferax sp.]
MTVKNLLVELFVEELPPKSLQRLGDAFAAVLLEQLKAQGLASAESQLTAFASPRRLAAHITAVAPFAADKAVSAKLMPVAVGLTADGEPTPALLKKLQALGAGPEAVAGLKRAVDGKAEALFFERTVAGARLQEGLQKALLEAIAKLPIPKVMTYQLASGCAQPGWTSVSFVRPAHGLVALHGSDIVPVEALGLQSGNTTHGHRFEAAVDPVVLKDADSYAATLARDGAVIASFADRRADIVRQLNAAAALIGNGVRAIEDEALLDEVTALVERPNVLVCSFEKEFLGVPQECLILTMKANQKYFPLLDAAGKLTHQFLIVSNIRPDDASQVIGGNERVVRPRLADAKFFFDQDRKKTLESRVAGLDKVVYHNQLGSQGERVVRVRAIAKAIAQQLGGETLAQQADQAALLAKTDLVTDMVGEFPELQGTMGRYYALNDGLGQDVADAIEDHYKPRFAGDVLPRNDVGTVVALADKLETLVGMFGIGNVPTGDRDPFALRRHALGVIRILSDDDSTLSSPPSLSWLLQVAISAFGPNIEDPEIALLDFFYDRIASSYRGSIFSPQQVDAVLSLRPVRLDSIDQRLMAVRAFAALPEAAALAAANKRIGNILKKTDAVDPHANPALFQESAEHALFAAMQQAAPVAQAQFEAGDYTASLQSLAALRAPVDAFFDGVMVNAEALDVRLNRLGLLQSLHNAMNRVADLSKLAT